MTKSGGYVVVVKFHVADGFRAEFKNAVLDNARKSLAVEPACQVFDVCEATDGPVFYLYEVYDDQAAFSDHLQTPHFRSFDDEVRAWVKDKTVATYTRLAT